MLLTFSLGLDLIYICIFKGKSYSQYRSDGQSMGLSKADKKEVNRLVKRVYEKNAVPIRPITDDNSDCDLEDGEKSEKFEPIPIKDWPGRYVDAWTNERQKRFDAAKEKNSGEVVTEDELIEAVAVAERALHLTRSWFLVFVSNSSPL